MRAVALFFSVILLSSCAAKLPASVATRPTIAACCAEFVPKPAAPDAKARLLAAFPELDHYFRSQLTERGATGLSVGIVLDGELVYARGFGVQDIESNTAVDADTVFRIASLSKSFTALAVLKLRDEGKLLLDAPASAYLPALASLQLPTSDAPPITPRLLLTHAAGLFTDDNWGPVTFGWHDNELERFLRAGKVFSAVPGMRYGYSNLGYALLGRLVQNVSGVPFRRYVDTNILLPLGMNATVWEARDVPAPKLAIGYRHAGASLVQEPRPGDGVFDAAGGLYTSLRDYARYVAYQLAAYPPRNEPEAGPVKRSTLREMHQGQRWTRMRVANTPVARRTDTGFAMASGSYGFGWHNVTTCDDEGRVQHFGFEPGYLAAVYLLPERALGVVTFATTSGVRPDGAIELLRQRGALPEVSRGVSEGLKNARQAVIQLLGHWDVELARQAFDEVSLKYSWATTLREDLTALSRLHGSCSAEGMLTAYNSTQGRFRLACTRGAIDFFVDLVPGTPPRMQALAWQHELPADEQLQKLAARLASALLQPDDPAFAEILARSLPLSRAKKILARLAFDHAECRLGAGVLHLEPNPFGTDRNRALFRLECAAGPLELSFSVDASSGQITDLEAHPPHTPDSLCWQ